MKPKILALLLLPLALLITTSANAEKKVRMELTGCLQAGPEPNTFVLNDINKGSTHRNETGIAPKALARADDLVFVGDQDKDLQKHIGQKVKVSGWISGERTLQQPASVTDTGDKGTLNTTNVSEFKVTKISKVSGTCR